MKRADKEVQNFIVSLIFIYSLLCPATGNALPSAPMLASVFSADLSRSSWGGNHSFLSAPEQASIGIVDGFKYKAASSSFRGFPVPVRIECTLMIDPAEPATVVNDGLFDMLIPLFIGSILIGIAGFIKKFGTSSEPVEKFARMGVASPYKKAVPS